MPISRLKRVAFTRKNRTYCKKMSKHTTARSELSATCNQGLDNGGRKGVTNSSVIRDRKLTSSQSLTRCRKRSDRSKPLSQIKKKLIVCPLYFNQFVLSRKGSKRLSPTILAIEVREKSIRASQSRNKRSLCVFP